jgi:Ni,Fe-hydrogenase III small subunit
MAWKKIIVSGSQAELSNIVVDNSITASAFSGDGSALTFAGTNIVSGSEQVVANLVNQDVNLGTGDISASNLQLTGNANIDGNLVLGGNITIGDNTSDNIILGGEISSSIVPDADGTYNLGSDSKRWLNVYGDNIYGDGSNLTNITVSQAATIASSFTNQTSVAVSHNFDSKNVTVTVYNSSDQLILPASVTLTDNDTATVTFDSSTSGRVVVAKGGHIVSGSISADNIDGFDAKVKTKLDADNVVSSSAQIVAALPTGTVSGSTQITALGFISESFSTSGTGIVSSSAFSSPTQGTVRAVINGVTTDVDTGLQSGDSPQFTNLTLTGDLTVQGTTTSIETANLLVEDKFILVSSGSANGDGGLVVDGEGVSFGYDSSEGRWSFDSAGATANQTTISTDAFAVGVVDIDAGHSDIAAYQKNGNIKTDSGNIYIYS